jgi:hypothetical protein
LETGVHFLAGEKITPRTLPGALCLNVRHDLRDNLLPRTTRCQ